MSRVLVTGGTGTVGVAIVRRLLADPAYDVRVADRKEAPQWMREGCEIRIADLRDREHASSAMQGCDQVIHLAKPSEQPGVQYSLLSASAALDSAVLSAAIDQRVQRFVYVSCARGDDLGSAPARLPAPEFAWLLGERLCQAAHDEHELSLVVCHQPAPLEDVDVAAEEIVGALV